MADHLPFRFFLSLLPLTVYFPQMIQIHSSFTFFIIKLRIGTGQIFRYDFYHIFAELLKKHSVKAADVAKSTGIPPSTFSDWKKGKSCPKNEKLLKIADYFNVSVDYILGREVKPKGFKEKYLLSMISESGHTLSSFSEKCRISEKELNTILVKGINTAKGNSVLLICRQLGIQTSALEQLSSKSKETALSAFDRMKFLLQASGSELSAEEKLAIIKLISSL